MMIRHLALLAAALLALASCDPYDQDEYVPFTVVESYLIDADPYPIVRLSRTAPVDEAYEFEQTAIRDAVVYLHLVAADGSIERTTPYGMTTPGVYAPLDTEILVKAGRTYRLEAAIPGQEQIVRGESTVPESIRIVGGVRDTVTYQSEDQLEIVVSSETGDQGQNVYVFNTIAIDTLAANLTPFYLSTYDDGQNVTLEELAKTSSGALNEGNFTRNPDGTITLAFPWIGIAFYGRNQIVLNVIDRNLHDYVRSASVQLGGSTLSPGEIQNAIYRLDGAIGVFGSLSSDTLTTFVKPAAAP